jgi:manganese/zinc/iron transport system ATP- binding protein
MIQQVDNPVIELHDLSVSYDKKPVLWGVDFSLPSGKLIGIVGPNGAGKSTLLKSMMGLIPLSSGYIHFFGKSLDEARTRVSYVPQRESVDWDFPTSVSDVVMMGRFPKMGLLKRPSAHDKAVVAECIEKVGLTDFRSRQIAELSGGQQQRVFIARALAQEADVYLMDEPFAGVDAATEKTLLSLMQAIAAEGKTIIVVHHDLHSVARYFEWIILLNMRLVASGPAQEVLNSDLLQEAYGGKLTLLSEISEIMKSGQYPKRDHTA